MGYLSGWLAQLGHASTTTWLVLRASLRWVQTEAGWLWWTEGLEGLRQLWWPIPVRLAVKSSSSAQAGNPCLLKVWETAEQSDGSAATRRLS